MTRKRKGRPRRTETRRYPSGDPHRSERQVQEETLSVGYQARERVHGLSKERARSEHAGRPIGRLFLEGTISAEQHGAAEEYERIVRRYRSAILVRMPRSAGDLDRSGGHDGDDGTDERYVERCNKARRAYGDARRALLDADPLAWMAAEAWCIDDVPMWTLVGELRVGLNALARLFKTDSAQAKAA